MTKIDATAPEEIRIAVEIDVRTAVRNFIVDFDTYGHVIRIKERRHRTVRPYHSFETTRYVASSGNMDAALPARIITAARRKLAADAAI